MTNDDRFLLHTASPTNTAEIIKLILDVKSGMLHPEWFAVDETYLRETLSDEKAWIFEATDQCAKTVSILVALYPVPLEDHLGKDAGLPETEWSKAAYIDMAATLPEGRGHHLQLRLMSLAEKHLAKRGVKYLLCTVHPDNTASRKSIERAGFVHQTILRKYGNLLRCVYLKQI